MAEATEHLRVVITAQDQASAVISNIGHQFRVVGSEIARGALLGIGYSAINRVGDAFAAAAQAAISFNASLEQSRIGWTTMLGSAAAAQNMLSQLQDFAESTPFDFPQVEQAARRFMAMGFAARDVIPLMRSVAEAAAATGAGADGVNRISLALGQMSARTKVSAQDMMQLTEVGVPAWQILADATGQSVAQVMDASEKGQISADTMIQAFQRFADLHWKDLLDPTTFDSIMSNIGDRSRRLLADSFQPLFEGIKRGGAAFFDFLKSDAMSTFALNVQKAQIAIAVFLDTIRNSGPILTVFEGALAGIAAVLGVQLVAAAIRATVALAPLVAAFLAANAPLIALGVAAAAAGVVIAANFEQIVKSTQALRDGIGEALGSLATWIGQTLVPRIVENWIAGWSSLADVVVAALNTVTQLWNAFWTDTTSTGETAYGTMLEQARAGWGGFVQLAINSIREVLEIWNTFIGLIPGIREKLGPILGAGDRQVLDMLEGKFANIDDITQNWRQSLEQIPGAMKNIGSGFGAFLTDELPKAVARARDLLVAAGGDLSKLPDLVLAEFNKMAAGLGNVGDLGGKQFGTNLGTAAVAAAKPLLEQLQRMLAQLAAGPATAALEDTQAAIERDRLLLQIRGLPAEARTQARREIRELTRNVLPGQQLEEFDVRRVVTQAQRAENQAQLILDIMKTQRELAGGAAAGVTGGPTTAAGGVAIAPPPPPPPTVIDLRIEVSTDGSAPQVFQELIEANGQAQMPPVIQVSAVRRN